MAAGKIFRQGKKLCEDGDTEEGVSLISEAIKLKPKEAEFWTHRSYWLKRILKYEESISDAQTALKLKPCNVIALKTLFESYLYLGDINQCKWALNKIQRSRSPVLKRMCRVDECNDLLDHYLLIKDTAVNYYNEKKYSFLVAETSKALEIAPRDGKMLYYKACGQHHLKNYDEMIQQITPNLFKKSVFETAILELLAWSYWATNDLSTGIKILNSHPAAEEELLNRLKTVEDYRQTAQSLLSNKQYSEAFRSIRKCKKLTKDFLTTNPQFEVEVHLIKAECYKLKQSNEKSLKHMEKVIEMKPNEITTLESLFKIHWESKEYDAATKDANKILKLVPGNVEETTKWEQRRDASTEFKKVQYMKDGKVNLSQALWLFGLQRSASKSDLKAKYGQMMKLYHPDKQHGKDVFWRDYCTYYTKLLNAGKKLLELNLREIIMEPFRVSTPKVRDSSKKYKNKYGIYETREAYNEAVGRVFAGW